MEAANNLLGRPTLSVSPYQSASAGSLTSSPQDSRRLNGAWQAAYGMNDAVAAAAGHGHCNLGPYASSFGAPSVPSHKAPYSSYAPLSGSTVSDFLAGQNCQQMQLNQALNPLNSFGAAASRNFPFYPGDMYNPSPAGMHGSSLFSDLSGMHPLPRFDAEAMGYPGPLSMDQGAGELTHSSIAIGVMDINFE